MPFRIGGRGTVFALPFKFEWAEYFWHIFLGDNESIERTLVQSMID